MNNCPLCGSFGKPFYEDQFFVCSKCEGIYKNRVLLLDQTKEKERYTLHSDDPNDSGYQKFVSPIINSVLADFTTNDLGLDFGTGQSQIIATILQSKQLNIKVYDPYFAPFKENLLQQYNFITACEVIEHFNDPKKEFLLLDSLLQRGGKLYCMTHLYDETIDFEKWYYKNDTTHIFIYQKNTMRYIQNHFHFQDLFIDKRLVVFTK